MGYSPLGHKESDMYEHARTFLIIFQGFSTLVQQQSPLGVGCFCLFVCLFVLKKKLPDQMRIYGGGAVKLFFFLKAPQDWEPLAWSLASWLS